MQPKTGDELMPSSALSKPFFELGVKTLPNTREEFEQVLKDILDLHSRKNADYHDSWRRTGFVGLYIHLSKKFAGMEGMLWNQRGNTSGEPLQERFMDMAVYSILGILLCKDAEKRGLNPDEYDEILRKGADDRRPINE